MRPERRHVTSKRRLNGNNIEFQVELERSEGNPEDTSEEAPGNQLQPTVFIQHGWMVADHP